MYPEFGEMVLVRWRKYWVYRNSKYRVSGRMVRSVAISTSIVKFALTLTLTQREREQEFLLSSPLGRRAGDEGNTLVFIQM